nr:protein BREAST CANCER SUSCEPTIBILITY 2 homolog B-like [Ipomoea trifida]
MPTWQIHSDAGNTFRWQMSDQQPSSTGVLAPMPPLDSHCLPSMADLLRRQGCAKLMENSNGNSASEKVSVFLDGSENPMAVKQSSIAKALSILQDEEGENGREESGTGFQNLVLPTCSDNAINQSNPAFPNSSGKAANMSNSMFQTGSGKSVTISPAGLVRARKLLNLEETETFQDLEQANKLSASADDPFGWQNSFPLRRTEESNSGGVNPNVFHFSPKPHAIKFQTAGGRSISVSSDALQRAKSLLGDTEHSNFLDEKDAASPLFSFSDNRKSNSNLSISKSKPCTPSYQCSANGKSSSSRFTSPLKSTLQKRPLSASLENMHPANNLIKHFDAVADDSAIQSYNGIPRHRHHLQQKSNMLPISFTEKDIASSPTPLERSSIRVLTDISNTIAFGHTDGKQNFGGARRLGRMNSVSPFKRPRVAKFTPPLNKNMSVIPNGMSNLAPKESSFKQRVSDRYPFEVVRLYMKEYVGEPPYLQTKLVNVGDQVRTMNPATAESYVFHDESGQGVLGIEAFYRMLSHFGASEQYFSKVWAANHYKWIVWKLACYERCFPAKFSGKLLTFSNVLEELKYRYEREVNYGHRSAIKRILEGDAPPSSMMVLCISSIDPVCDSKVRPQDHPILPVGVERTSKIELTDGWYSITALLDGILSKMLAAKKLFLGQKLRIWGASLCGWVGPVSPLEVSKETSLVLHINGTYRAHWADRLGFCKGRGVPLAFNSIKDSGGAVPITLVGISRIYPVLYRERLSNGGFIVRNERMEAKAINQYNQRRSIVAEGIASEIQNTNIDILIGNDYESEEGAKLLKILETAAEPDILMAEMTFEQLNSFSSYKAKLEAKKQSHTQKSLDRALEAAGLKTRDVTPFMRVRVVGLTSKSTRQGHSTRDGLITIWNPTEEQKVELTEGQAYAVSGLVALSSDSNTLHLQTRGSTTKWQPLSSSGIQHFWPFFSPRRPNSLSSLGEVPLSSEFDIVALVIYVGELHTVARQKKQWVFVTDGTQTALDNSLLAISFSSVNTENESFAPEHSYPEGTVVSFCNLIKRDRDRTNHLWVAEGTETSTYHLSYDHPHCSHLKRSVSFLKNWVKTSGSRIEQLKGKVISIISNSVA